MLGIDERPVPVHRTGWTVDDTVRLLAAGRDDYDLTAEQRAAVGAPLEPGLLVAGAGSGKTEVMAARVLHLVATRQVRPEAVLGLTFTVKATASLAERVRSALDRLRDSGPEWADGLDGEPTISTYNGFGARLVADHGLRIGIEPGVRLAPEGLRWQLALRVVRAWAGELEVDVQPATIAQYLRQLYDQMSDHLVDREELLEAHRRLRAHLTPAGVKMTTDVRKIHETMALREQLLGLVDEYVRAKRDHLLLDHGDQIAMAARLAGLAPVRAVERRSFAVVLLDEYQDTNVAQRILLQRLFGDGHPVTAVGDPAQSIYGFRGASVSNIVRFPEQFPRRSGVPAQTYPLSTNFRSGGAILAAANRVSAGLERVGSVDPPVLVPRAGREVGGPNAGSVRSALLPDVEQEAEWVAAQLADAARGRRAAHQQECTQPDCQGWHEVAVLCRKRRQFGLLRNALERLDVPVEIIGLGGLLDTPEVADLVSVLRVLHDPTSNAAMIRLLTGPRWRVGPRDLEALGRRARALLGQAGFRTRRAPVGTPEAAESAVLDRLGLAAAADDVEVGALADALERLQDQELQRLAPLSPEAVRRLERLQAELTALRRRIGQPLPDLVADVERTLGLDVELEASPRAVGRGRRANVLAFADVAANFVGLEGETHLGAFLASLDAAEDAEDGYDLGTPSAADAVKLMTVHAAKGLEWDLVAVPGLSGGSRNGVFPSSQTSPQWISRYDRVPRDVRGDREDLPSVAEPSNKAIEAFKAACKAKDQQEERRLAYVALTRAKDLLLCSGYWWGPTAKSANVPTSPFFEEVEAACLEGAGVAEARAEAPADGECNPLLDADRHPDVDWPPPPVVPPGVAWAAEAVRIARDAPAPVPRAQSVVDVAAGQDGELKAGEVSATQVSAAEVSAAEVSAAQVSAAQVGHRLTVDEQQRLAEWRRDAELLLEERRASAGIPDVVLPADLSVSDVVALEGDPSGLARRLQRPLPQRPLPQARRGTAFHAWLEQRSTRRSLLAPDDLPGSGDSRFSDPSAAGDEELAALQRAFLATSFATRDPVAVEVPFEFVLGAHLVRGRIDAVYENDDGTYDVVDYKTGSRPAGHSADAAALQLACYRLAWCDLTGLPPNRVGAAFLYVRDGDDGLVRPRLVERDELARLLTSLPDATDEA